MSLHLGIKKLCVVLMKVVWGGAGGGLRQGEYGGGGDCDRGTAYMAVWLALPNLRILYGPLMLAHQRPGNREDNQRRIHIAMRSQEPFDRVKA